MKHFPVVQILKKNHLVALPRQADQGNTDLSESQDTYSLPTGCSTSHFRLGTGICVSLFLEKLSQREGKLFDENVFPILAFQTNLSLRRSQCFIKLGTSGEKLYIYWEYETLREAGICNRRIRAGDNVKVFYVQNRQKQLVAITHDRNSQQQYRGRT